MSENRPRNIYATALLLLGAVLVLPLHAFAEEISDAAMSEARRIYQGRCVACHGETGKGDGSLSASFDPRPRDLTSNGWQESVTDEYIEKILLQGGAAVGKSMMMPGNPDLKSKPEVLRALRVIVRDLGK